MTVRLKLTIGWIVAVLLANAVLSLVVVTYLESAWLTEVQTRVRLDLNSARFAYQSHIRHLAAFLEASVAGENRPLSPQRLQQIRRLAPMDFLTVLDAQGHVISRPQQAQPNHDDLSQNPLVAAVLKTRQSASSTLVTPADVLAREGAELAARARVDIVSTPEVQATAEQPSTDGLVVAAAVPLLDPAGKLQGVLYGGDLLNHRDDLVDYIRDAVCGSAGSGPGSLDTVTIFLGNLRIATNVPGADGARAVGTRMSQEVAGEVLERGGTWAGPARVVNDWYIAAYEPIRDPQQKIVGALYVGLLWAPFLHKRNTLTGVVLVMVASGALACILLIFFLDYLVLRPARKVIQMARRVMGGDLTARVKIRPPGEIGILCQAVDHMADNLAEREQQLKAATSRQLSGSEKLASLGRLAAGVAHEINNPLTGVLTFAHLLREKTNMTDQDREDLDLIIHETTRAAEIVRGLLDFARERPVVMEPLSVNEVVARTVRLIQNQKLFDRIVINEELAHDLPDIEGDMNQLQQVLLNLSLNACEAMPSGGTLTIRTRVEDDRVVVQLADTGCGIKQEHFDRIFEPFFTTKPVGKGTGLGLSVSYGIVQRHGGGIEVESEEGKGTTFIIELPALKG